MSNKELNIDGIHIRNILYRMFSVAFTKYFRDKYYIELETLDSYKDFKFILKYNTSKKYFDLTISYKDNLIVNVTLTHTMIQTSPFHIDIIIKCIEEMSDVELYQDKED